VGRKHLVASDFAAHTRRSSAIRKHMVEHIAAVPARKVAVLLSAGVDSHACLFAALEAKKQVTCYSFTLDDRISTDYHVARQTARTFGLPFVGIKLPTDLRTLQTYLWDLYNVYSKTAYKGGSLHVNKSSVECMWPLYSALNEVVQENTATVFGLGGDTFFCQMRSQKKRLHEYEKVKEEYCVNVVDRKIDIQTLLLQSWFDYHAPKHHLVAPFHTRRMFKIFEGMHPFEEGCVPIQKAPVRFAFWPQFSQTDVRVHQSFQKGDSGISDHFSKMLVGSSWNTRELKSVKGIYNDLEMGLLPKPRRT
jgi:asparagine synthetase B (glutamine-hydrolysing)